MRRRAIGGEIMRNVREFKLIKKKKYGYSFHKVLI